MHIMNVRTAVALSYLALLLVFPGGSYGHAFPDHSIPRVGETNSAPPVGAYIWFDGDIEPAFSKMTVQDMSGKQVDQGNSRVDPSNSVLLEVGLPPLPAGTYRVIWNVVARDGHRTTGDFRFTIK
jgi:copper resistance protein C